jgi:hypothetical protein
MPLCVGKFPSDQHTRRSPTQSDTYQMLYWYNWFSWWWARGCSKHVDKWNKCTRIVPQVGNLQNFQATVFVFQLPLNMTLSGFRRLSASEPVTPTRIWRRKTNTASSCSQVVYGGWSNQSTPQALSNIPDTTGRSVCCRLRMQYGQETRNWKYTPLTICLLLTTTLLMPLKSFQYEESSLKETTRQRRQY